MNPRILVALTLLMVGSALIGGVAVQTAIADENNPIQDDRVEDTDSDANSNPDSDANSDQADFARRFNVPIKTGGGTQLWTDHAYRNGYRIQRHALTGHYRLIDDADVRRAWGSREACTGELDRLKPVPGPVVSTVIHEPGMPETDAAPPRHFVILLHGLMRTHHSMKPLETALAGAGMTDVIRFSYASTRGSIGDHAAALNEVIESMPDDTEFSFVGHSMGNIVVRHWLGDLRHNGDPSNVIPRCHAMVMLGPPNQGAAIARRSGADRFVRLVDRSWRLGTGARLGRVRIQTCDADVPLHHHRRRRLRRDAAKPVGG